MATGATQQYCLRWNNHRTNLLTVFEELLQNEAFTDVTLVCDGGQPIKCHRMVLAACSPYFQNLFIDLPCKHPVVVLKDVRYGDIKAILEYMYRGEVNVAQDQLAGLLKVAEALKVKGLVENRSKSPVREEIPPQSDHSPSVSTSNAQHIVHSSSNSPPPQYKNPYGGIYDRKLQDTTSRMSLPLWAVPGLPLPPQAPQISSHGMLSGAYEGVGGDMSPLKRKKLSSLLAQRERDTPILRTVLGQGQPDSSQPVSLVCHSDSAEGRSSEERDRIVKQMKNEPSEDAQSPYTDYSERMDDDDKPKHAVPVSSPQSLQHGVSPGIAPYVPAQKPEWKRYKQYTRNDIMSAIEAVRSGMSALQAARKYGVPSRTLYDKVKKLGITTSRPFKRGSNGSSACFPYSSSSPYHLSESEEPPMNNNSTLLEASFLQHALDRSGDDREALAAMAAAHMSPGHARSPSPSPTMLKYVRHSSLTPSPNDGSDRTNGSSQDDDDRVEDLSVGRKSRVIVPPMNQVSAIIKKEEMLIESIKEEMRREVSADAE